MSWFSKSRTVESIVAPITRIVDNLHAHAEYHETRAVEQTVLANELAQQAGKSKQESLKAADTAGKIAGLVT